MSIIYSSGNEKVKILQPHDPDETNIYTNVYRPPAWTQNTEVVKDEDVFTPTSSSGLLHECISGGITGSTEPTWETVENGVTEDNTSQFKAKPLTSMLRTGDTITLSTWAAKDKNGVVVGTVVSDEIIDGIITECSVNNIPNDIKSFELTNEITILRVGGKTEIKNRTIIVTVKQL